MHSGWKRPPQTWSVSARLGSKSHTTQAECRHAHALCLVLDLLKFCKLRNSTGVQAKVAEEFAVAGWSDLCLSGRCLVVLLAAAIESHGAKPSLASWPACQRARVERDMAN